MCAHAHTRTITTAATTTTTTVVVVVVVVVIIIIQVQELPALGSKVLGIKSPESSSDELQLPEKQLAQRGPKWDTPGRHSRDFSTHKLGKLLLVGRARRSILPESVKCVLHIRCKVKLDTYVNSTWFCFTEGLVLRYST